MHWKRLIIAAGSLALLFSPLVTEPCGGGYEPDAFGLFPMHRTGIRQFYTFLYSVHSYNGDAFLPYEGYEGVTTFENDTLDRASYAQHDLVADWRRYTQGQVPVIDLYHFLYKMPAHQLLASDTGFAARGSRAVTESATQNALVNYALRRSDKSLLDYLVYCKSVEAVFATIEDPWGFEEPAYDNIWMYGNEGGYASNYQQTSEMERSSSPWQPSLMLLSQVARKRMHSCRDSWLRQRYAYQLMVLARYLHEWPVCTSVYQQYFDSSRAMPGLRQWAQLYAGIAHRQMGQQAQADLLLAQVFAYSTSKQRNALEHFSGDADGAVALARTPQEKAAIWLTQAAGNPALEMKALQQVYQLTGYTPQLRFMVLREIGKIDDFLPASMGDSYMSYDESASMLSPTLYGNSYESRPMALPNLGPWQIAWSPRLRQHIEQLLALCKGAAEKPATQHSRQWQLMAAHLHLYLGQISEASRYINKALMGNVTPETRAVLTMYQVLIHTFEPGLDQNQRREAVARRLQKLASQERTPGLPWNAFAYLLIKRFEQLDDPVAADLLECIVGDGAVYRQPMTVLEGLEKNQLGSLGALAKNAPKQIWSHLYRVAAINALIDEKPAVAAQYFERAGDTEPNGSLDEDPTRIRYFSNHGANPLPNGRTVSKVEWCRNLAALQASASGSFDKTLALANSYYNMSYYGNSWNILSDGWSVYDADGTGLDGLPAPYSKSWSSAVGMYPAANGRNTFLPPGRQQKYLQVYLGCQVALKHYQRAQQLAPSRQAAAACALMVGRCRYRLNYNSFPLLDPNENLEETQQRVRETYTELYSRFPELADDLVGNCEAWGRFIKMH